MKKWILISIFGIITLTFWSCTSLDTVHRDTVSTKDLANCEGQIFRADEKENKEDPKFRCAIQNHHVPGAKDTSDITNRFKLAFLEFSESTGDMFHPELIPEIFNSSDAKKYYVITFVHGWRHDADIGNGNLSTFKTLLSYSRSFLNQRCKKEQKQDCETELVGLYVGWRGKSAKENISPEPSKVLLGYSPNDIQAALTFYRRKNLSKKLAPALMARLLEVDQTLQKFSGSKVLTVGHSFGGNMLANGMLPMVLGQLENSEEGNQLKSPIGDLVVLLNPASEASNWNQIQRAVKASKISFGSDQKPTYISITATCEWSKNELKSLNGEPVACDTDTKDLFPFAQKLVPWLRNSDEKTTTIGHYKPDYKTSGGAAYYPIDENQVGATHEIILNKGNKKNTAFRSLVDRENSVCDIADGWLRIVRNRAQGGADLWDTHYYGVRMDRVLNVDKTNRTNVQIRRSLSISGVKVATHRSIAAKNTPFWNMRAFNSLKRHNGFYSYPTWCTINQMVLDDITR